MIKKCVLLNQTIFYYIIKSLNTFNYFLNHLPTESIIAL